MSSEAAKMGIITLVREMPADLIAMSSLFSAIWPMVMTEPRSVASGRHSGRVVQLPQNMNSMMTLKLKPLPTSSSMYTQRN